MPLNALPTLAVDCLSAVPFELYNILLWNLGDIA